MLFIVFHIIITVSICRANPVPTKPVSQQCIVYKTFVVHMDLSMNSCWSNRTFCITYFACIFGIDNELLHTNEMVFQLKVTVVVGLSAL